jgi:hypothetical protein
MVNDIARRAADNERDLDLLRTWANRYPGDRPRRPLDALTTAGRQDVESWVAILDGLSFDETTETMVEHTIVLVPRLIKVFEVGWPVVCPLGWNA